MQKTNKNQGHVRLLPKLAKSYPRPPPEAAVQCVAQPGLPFPGTDRASLRPAWHRTLPLTFLCSFVITRYIRRQDRSTVSGLILARPLCASRHPSWIAQVAAGMELCVGPSQPSLTTHAQHQAFHVVSSGANRQLIDELDRAGILSLPQTLFVSNSFADDALLRRLERDGILRRAEPSALLHGRNGELASSSLPTWADANDHAFAPAFGALGSASGHP